MSTRQIDIELKTSQTKLCKTMKKEKFHVSVRRAFKNCCHRI